MKTLQGLKKRVFEIIQIGNRSDVPSLLFDAFIVVVILLNIFVTFFMTFEEAAGFAALLNAAECITILIFLVEYLLRLWTAEFLYPDRKKLQAKWEFMMSFYGIVDLLTILPYFLPFLFPSGAVAFRMMRVVRILHLFRINANYDAFNVVTDVLRDKKDQLMSSIFLLLVLMMAASLCMYSLEHEAQPEHFRNAFSGIWWSVSTLLTVGYGDIYPVTAGGQLMAIVIAFLGVGMVAIPTGIISAGFVEYYTRIKSVAAARNEADFLALRIEKGHPYIGRRVGDVQMAQGIYMAAVLRKQQILTQTDELTVERGDVLLYASTSNLHVDAKMEELVLEKGHVWIGKQIGKLDLSRNAYVLMVKRGNASLKPQDSMRLREQDRIILLDRRTIRQ